jgi:hypothetical protein
MFSIVKQVINWNGDLYIIKRSLKEDRLPENLIQEFREFVVADAVVKKDGILHFIQKIDEAQIVEEEKSELGEVIES